MLLYGLMFGVVGSGNNSMELSGLAVGLGTLVGSMWLAVLSVVVAVGLAVELWA